MEFIDLDPTIESTLESQLFEIHSKLAATFEERADIIENGFSFSSSLKDISRFILTNLNNEFNNDFSRVLYVVNNWSKFVEALANKDILDFVDQELFPYFSNVYYSSIDYFNKQFLTHLGEKVEFASEQITDEKVLRFVEKTGFKQRKFEYGIDRLGQNSIEFLTASTFRTYEIKKSEREKIELLNSIVLRFLLNAHEKESLIAFTLNRFPELKPDLENILEQLNNVVFLPGQNIIQISPPFENYSYQHECMINIFTYTGVGFNVTQYSIPFNKPEVDIALTYLTKGGIAQQINTLLNSNFESSQILSKLIISNSASPSWYLNSFSSIVDFGGAQVLEDATNLLKPKLDLISQAVNPFIVEFINSPAFCNNSNSNLSTKKYKEIFLSAIATLDVNIQEDNPDIADVLESGDLLRAAVEGESTSNVLYEASGGLISDLNISSNGNCDAVSGTIGTQIEVQESFTIEELNKMEYKGVITNLTKEGDMQLELQKFVDKNGNEHKLFICPICKSKGIDNYVDICAESCPRCSVSLNDMRLAAEKQNLSGFVKDYAEHGSSYIVQGSGNGIFGVLFDLFGVVFSFF